jgi:glycosyltransferase involved in cell wall biosynthesis
MVAPPWFAIPPPAYGGIEAMVAGLVDGLVGRGHHVTLVGAGRPGTRAQRYVAVYEEPPTARLGSPLPEVVHAAAAAAALDAEEIDVVHDHTLAGPLLAGRRAAPTLVTAHGAVDGETGDYLAHLGGSVDVVAISRAQQRRRRDINWISAVHNAVDVASFPLGEGDGGYLLFVGRFSPDKGAHVAVDAARAAGRRLLLAGKCNEPAEKAYFADAIAPELGRDVEYLGEADAEAKRELYAGAEALLFPVCWEEPFGLVMVEAMACGTPVVALRRGSVPEVVVDGRTGVVVDDPGDLPRAIAAAGRLDRSECRSHVEAHFDTPAMVAAYEAVYRTVVDRRELRLDVSPTTPRLVTA